MRLIDADEFEKRISEYNTTDITDSILYNFAHSKLISMPTVEDKPQVEEKNICDSCENKACIFDSHVARQKCDFYKPQKGWIPVSERLPKRTGEYFVTVIDDSGEDNYYKAVGVAWFAHKKDYDIKESEWRELGTDETVIAWMPLPTAYNPQESEEV